MTKRLVICSKRVKNGRKKGDYEKLSNMITKIIPEISHDEKILFDNLAEKLCDPKLNRKALWSILKSSSN